MFKVTQALSNNELEEKTILKNLDHPNLIKYIDIFQTADKFICVVKEVGQRGNLVNALKTLGLEKYDEESLKYILK